MSGGGGLEVVAESEIKTHTFRVCSAIKYATFLLECSQSRVDVPLLWFDLIKHEYTS